MKRWVVYTIEEVGSTRLPLCQQTPATYTQSEVVINGEVKTLTCVHEGRTRKCHIVRTGRVGVVVARTLDAACTQASRQWGKLLRNGFTVVRER